MATWVDEIPFYSTVQLSPCYYIAKEKQNNYYLSPERIAIYSLLCSPDPFTLIPLHYVYFILITIRE